MSSFGSRRKARVINVDNEEGEGAENAGSAPDGASTTESVQPAFKSKSVKKGIRQSGLRKTLTADAFDGDLSSTGNDEQDDGPVVVKPKFGAQKQRKKPKSRLSFGLGNNEEEDDTVGVEASAKQSTLGQRAIENNAVRRGIAMRGLPTRTFEDDNEKPRYSREYLDELQSSTPTTPMDTGSIPTDVDEMELDASELEGALIVDSPAQVAPAPKIQIFSEAEIQERRERRARLAKEQEFLSVEEDDDDGRTKKKDNTRLIVDEDQLGEGFDEFVEDGGMSLGKRAEKQRRKQDRQRMAELINAAEGQSSDSSSDSEAERRMAYESAQTRAGMDGLKRPRHDPSRELLQIPPRITPLPGLAHCMARLQATLGAMQAQIQLTGAAVEQMRAEKQGIAAREREVQALLDETGKKYQEAMGRSAEAHGAAAMGAGGGGGLEPGFAGDRGPESLGSTPGRAVVDVGEDAL